jgi:hypothetical protein
MSLKPIDRASFKAPELIREHPPRWHDDNKRCVFEIACSSGAPHDGPVTFARWPLQELPISVTGRAPFTIFPGVFSYSTPDDPAIVPWYLNFSDPHLFVAYDSGLMAQDELQVAEHPVLGSLRDALLSKAIPAVTCDQQGKATPVTITGAQRRCAIDTAPDAEAGRPAGLYGNAFARATSEQVKAATRPLVPPTVSNILAVAAPPGGYGNYRREEIVEILGTAYTGFRSAREESVRLVADDSRTVIHTGFWGCGAFGGNRTLMTILQKLASDLAGVELVFWAFDGAGVVVARDAVQSYLKLRSGCEDVAALLDHLIDRGFAWGVSDGN